MKETIKVHVVDYGRASLYMRYVDPNTGKQVSRSTGETKKSEAQKKAGAWEKELREGKYKPRSRVTWAEFRERYEEDAFPDFAEASQKKFLTVFKAVEKILSPDKLSSLTTDRLDLLAKSWRDAKKSEHTVKGRLAMLRSALNWARAKGLLVDMPKINMPKRAKGSKMMKGRAVTGEEFDRMIASVPKVVRGNLEKWRRLLRGLWLSGLRLGEAIDLWWDREDRMHVDLSAKRPMLRIHAEQEKGGQDRLLPITPDFAEFLLGTPEAERTGRVFDLTCQGLSTISEVVSRIGEKAGVKVNTDPKTGAVKYASAHDLRRSFGTRWAALVMPQILMELMRHAEIETTLRYYVGHNAQTTADVVYAAAETAAKQRDAAKVAEGSLSGNS